MENTDDTILSSEEVESLLESLYENQGEAEHVDIIEEEGSRVKYYDFKRPNTVSREKKRSLYKLYEATAHQISREISNYLRTTIQVNLNSIEELSFEIFKNTCSELMLINTISLAPLHGYGCIAMDMGVCFSIVEKAFGGSGKTQNEIRKLTDTEIAILDNIMELITDKFAGSWKLYDDMKWRSSDSTMEPRYLNFVSDAEVVLLIAFTVNLEHSFGELKLCLPVSSMDKILGKLINNNTLNTKTGDSTKESTESLEKLVQNIKVVVAGVLDETNIPVRDIANLKVGDVLKLDSNITNNLKVSVEGTKKFYGRLGLYNSKKSIQITGTIKDGR
jgi:flagellar motor switch protein FliM